MQISEMRAYDSLTDNVDGAGRCGLGRGDVSISAYPDRVSEMNDRH